MFKKISLCLFLIIIIFNFVSAETINIGGYATYIPQGETFNIPFDCENCTYVNLTITFPNGSIIIPNGEMSSTNGFHWNYTFSDANTTGKYWISFTYLEEGRYIGTDQQWFWVTESGIEITESKSILAIGLLLILVALMFISLYGIFKIENIGGKFALYWVTHVLTVLICFAGWQFGVEGLLDGTGIVSIFRILFYVSTVAIFPMLILSIAWIFYIHTMNDDVRKMIDKGMPVEEAFKRSANRRYF